MHTMRTIIFLFAIILCGCSKPATKSTPGGGGSPAPAPTSNRIAMPYWGADTLVCVDVESGMRDPKHRIDCLILANIAGESRLLHAGKSYVAWIDTTWFKFQAYLPEYVIGVGISEIMSSAKITSSFTYSPNYIIQSGDTIPTLRYLRFTDSSFNKKALKGTWIGREPK